MLVGEGWNRISQPVHAAVRQQWDYSIIVRQREFDSFNRPGDWSHAWKDDADISASDMNRTVQQMGAQGWELVGVYTYSSGPLIGVTTDDRWVFRRPKQ